jgi:hypothetical protein
MFTGGAFPGSLHDAASLFSNCATPGTDASSASINRCAPATAPPPAARAAACARQRAHVTHPGAHARRRGRLLRRSGGNARSPAFGPLW